MDSTSFVFRPLEFQCPVNEKYLIWFSGYSGRITGEYVILREACLLEFHFVYDLGKG